MGQLSGQRKNSAVGQPGGYSECSPLGPDRCGVVVLGTGSCRGGENAPTLRNLPPHPPRRNAAPTVITSLLRRGGRCAFFGDGWATFPLC
jgi:hypothetical protein